MRVLLLLGVIALAAAQDCGIAGVGNNWTIINVGNTDPGTTLTVSKTFKVGDPFPQQCGWIIRGGTFKEPDQLVATLKTASVLGALNGFPNAGWNLGLYRVATGAPGNPPPLGAPLIWVGPGNPGAPFAHNSLQPPMDAPDAWTIGQNNSTDTSLPIAAKQMALVLTFVPTGATVEPPYMKLTAEFKFVVSPDRCPIYGGASKGNYWIPRARSATDGSGVNLVDGCQSYQNLSCCSSFTGLKSIRATYEPEPIDDNYDNSVGANTRPLVVTNQIYQNQWAANDTACFHYSQIAACGAMCSPNAKDWVTVNWGTNQVLDSITSRKTFKLCGGFCKKVWDACKGQRIIQVDTTSSPARYVLGPRNGELYATQNEFCMDYFRYTYPPSVASGKDAGDSGQYQEALPPPSGVLAQSGAMTIDIISDAGVTCFDPSTEPGSASALGVSLGLLLLSIALML